MDIDQSPSTAYFRPSVASLAGTNFSSYELANRLGVSLSSIYEHLKDLREYELVEVEEQEKRKVYRITEKGRYLSKALR